MTRIIYTTCAAALGLCGFAQAAPPQARLPEKHRAFFKAHCLDCHDSETREGKVDLEALSFCITTIEQAELWQKVLNALNSGEMPPEDSEQPGNTEKADFLDDLARTMVTARQALSDSGGKITMRRLNRREYRNTIEQLTGVKVDVGSLPTDGGSGTFDTVGASQFISSDQFEQYLKLGRQAIDEAFERQAAQKQPSRVFRVEPEETVNVQSRKNMKTMEETYKRYLLWKAEVDKAAALPENSDVLAQIREKYNLDDLTDSVRLYQNANLLKGGPDAKKFGFRDANAASFSYQGGYGRTYAYMKHYLELPRSDRGTYLKLAWAIQRIDVTPKPENVPPGTYKLRIRAGVVKGSDPSRHFIEVGHPQRVNQVPAGFASKPLASLQVTGTEDSPEIVETTLVIGSKTPREFGIQERRPEGNQKALSREFYAYKRENGYGTPPAIWVDWIELEGPITEAAVTESRIVRVEPEKTINPDNEKEIAQIEDAYKRFTQWQVGVDKAAATPENKAKIAELSKKEPAITHPIHFYRYAHLLNGAPDAGDFGFRDSGKAAAANPKWDRAQLAYHKHYAALPHRDRGAYLKLAYGTGWVVVAPKELSPGNYVMRVHVGAVKNTPAARRFIQVGHPQRLIPRNRGLAGRAISTHQVAGSIENPETIEIPLTVGSDTPKEFAIQEKQPNTGNLKELWGAHNEWKKKNGYGHPPAIWIDWVELEGPLPRAKLATSKTYRVEPETTINPKNEKAIKAMDETYKRFNQWRKGVDAVVKTPENQAIIAEIARTEPDILHPLRFYRYAHRLKGTPDARDFGFPEAHAPTKANPDWPSTYAYLKHYASLPHRDTGAYLKPTHGTGRVIVSPENLPLGNYTLRVRVGAVKGSDPSRHFIDVGHPQRTYTALEYDYGLEGRAISTHQVSGTIEEPQIIEVPLEVRSDTIREFAVQEKQPNNGKMKALVGAFSAAKKKNGYGIPPAIWVDWVELEGPHSAPKSHTRSPLQLVLAKHAGNPKRERGTTSDKRKSPSLANASGYQERARAILTDFANAAFRRVKPEAEFIDQLVAIYETRRKSGDSFDEAIRTPLSVILASPGFLYLFEPGDEAERRQLNDRELAVRLSYFLWSGPPDAELLQLAEQNKLHLPEVLRQQVDRLIADPRSDDFVAGFVHQWLDMERLDFFQFDVNLHRDFDESTRAATREEVYQSFAHLLRASKDGRLGKLLKSDYVFVNGLLATYYGIEGVTGDEFRKIKLPADSPRGGLLGMAAIHAMGSDGVVSSPVERGAWVLRHLLNDPPPPAPPNVPQISRLEGQILTTRERLLAHQEEAQCASCHRKIDPIGFGLENFNAAGKWRTEDSYQARDGRGRGVGKRKTWAIDASGAFHKGPGFNDYHELRDLIADREEDFAHGFTEHLIEYALGRPFGFTDEDLANEIVSSARSKEFAVSEFIHSLVQTRAFRTK